MEICIGSCIVNSHQLPTSEIVPREDFKVFMDHWKGHDASMKFFSSDADKIRARKIEGWFFPACLTQLLPQGISKGPEEFLPVP
jgi:hypothetical protein